MTSFGNVVVFLLGPPLSGKSTLLYGASKWLMDTHGVESHTLSSGEVARSLAETDGAVGEALDGGRMAPPKIMDEHMLEMVVFHSQLMASRGGVLVVDGYPRYMAQLMDVAMTIPALGMRPCFISLSVPEKELRRRAEDRRREGDDVDTLETRMRLWRDVGMRVSEYLHSRSWFPVLCYEGAAEREAQAKAAADWIQWWGTRPSGDRSEFEIIRKGQSHAFGSSETH